MPSKSRQRSRRLIAPLFYILRRVCYHSSVTPRRGLLWTALFVCLLCAPFLGEAYHIDEPYYLAVARQILDSPLHPGGFLYNADGHGALLSKGFATGPFVSYLLALPMKWTGGVEWKLRLACLPFDLAAALALFLLAGRFLSRPLLPVLIVVACPIYWLNMHHLMAEKWIGVFGFSGLYAYARGADEKKAPWLWASASLLAAALLAKYTAFFLLAPVAAYGWSRGERGRLALVLSAAAAPAALCLLAAPGSREAVWHLTALGSPMPWSAWSHRLRSLCAAVAGGAPVLLCWPFLLCRGRRLWAAAALSSALAALLFLPYFDLSAVRAVDRLTGAVFAAGTLSALAVLAWDPHDRNREFWASWTLAVALLQACVYWAVVSRYVLFLAVPILLWYASLLERALEPALLRRVHAASLALAIFATGTLGWVDSSYADAQRSFARSVAQEYRGRRLWFTGHWGLQYYMESAGAQAIDLDRGGWGQVRPGDAAVIPLVNTNVIKPGRRLLCRLRTVRVGHPLPLRLISAGGPGDGAFYSSAFGFLLYSLSAEPLEEFTILDVASNPPPQTAIMR